MPFRLVPVNEAESITRSIKDFTNDELLALYERVKDKLNTFEEANDIENYTRYLRFIEFIEDEGRRREMIYFLSDDEQFNLVKDVFGPKIEDCPCEVCSSQDEKTEDGDKKSN